VKYKKGFTLLEIMIVVSIIAILVAIIIPRIKKMEGRAKMVSCISNLKNIATAVNIYSNETMGQFPVSLTSIFPDFIGKIPECPAALKDTYTAGYTTNDEYNDFTVCCYGKYHAICGLDSNQPFYSAVNGIGP